MIPGRPLATYSPDIPPDELASWLLERVDEDGGERTLVKVPDAYDDEHLDDLEDQFRAAFDAAKDRRPGLALRLMQSIQDRDGRRSIVVELHEHEWVGGYCVRGCGTTYNDRKAA